MTISILLPYKENYSPLHAGAVSLFVKDVTKVSSYKKNIIIFGNTNSNKKLSKNYINLDLNKKISDYLPDIGSGYASATVQDVLDMNIENSYSEDYNDPYTSSYLHEPSSIVANGL